MSSITKFLPKNHLSYLIGKLAYLPLPQFLWTPIISWFARSYRINLNESEKAIQEYPTLGDFFVRRLKEGVRPLGSSWALHPADSLITQADQIKAGKLIQAKDKFYNVVDFTQDPIALDKYDNGFFVTYYLCPTDYHRVHSPVDGIIQKVTHIPGMLWPVNQWATENIEEMFSINERVCVEIRTDKGLVNVVFVGATNVGYITLSFLPEIKGNHFSVFKPLYKENLNISIRKGEELGMFKMGSTVVMLYSKEASSSIPPTDVQKLKNQRVLVKSSFF